MSRAETIKFQLQEKQRLKEENSKKAKSNSKFFFFIKKRMKLFIHSQPEIEKFRATLNETIIKEKPNITFKDVAGLESAKRAL